MDKKKIVVTKKVKVVNTSENDNKEIDNKKVIETDKVKVIPRNLVEKSSSSEEVSLDEHLKNNIDEAKKNKKIDWTKIVTYILMVIIIIGCLVLLFIFLDKQGVNPFTNTTTTTTTMDIKYISTSTTKTNDISYIQTTTYADRATHTVFVENPNSGNPDDSSSNSGISRDYYIKKDDTNTTTSDTN